MPTNQPQPPTATELIAAAKRADWIQVVLNQGPPCFHYEADTGKFCLRAQRWAGHVDSGEWPEHGYVSLDALLAALSASVPPQSEPMGAAEWWGVIGPREMPCLYGKARIDAEEGRDYDERVALFRVEEVAHPEASPATETPEGLCTACSTEPCAEHAPSSSAPSSSREVESIRALPKRNAAELAESLRGRAAYLSPHWENVATADMMREAADMLDRLHHLDAQEAELRGLRETLVSIVAQLRHAYANVRGHHVRDPRQFADRLLSPQIRKLETSIADLDRLVTRRETK